MGSVNVSVTGPEAKRLDVRSLDGVQAVLPDIDPFLDGLAYVVVFVRAKSAGFLCSDSFY